MEEQTYPSQIVIQPSEPAASKPVPTRVREVDALRGLALFGILLVNMWFFKRPEEAMRISPGALDQFALTAIVAFAAGKFYPIFSFCFGFGLAVQWLKPSDSSFTGRTVRRMLVLLLFGIAHGAFLWSGDILTYYAILGLALLAFQGISVRARLVLACLAIAGHLLIMTLVYGSLAFMEEMLGYYEAFPIVPVTETEAFWVYSSGSYLEIMAFRGMEILEGSYIGFVMLPSMFGMAILGWAAAQSGLAFNREAAKRIARRTLFVAPLVAGVFLYLFFAAGGVEAYYYQGGQPTQAIFVHTISSYALCFVYMSVLFLVMQTLVGKSLLKPLELAGRMPLTNYIGQSVICTTLFYSYGLGLYGTVGVAAGVGITIAVFAFNLVFSWLWLKRFEVGPLEWLWRRLAFGKRYSGMGSQTSSG